MQDHFFWLDQDSMLGKPTPQLFLLHSKAIAFILGFLLLSMKPYAKNGLKNVVWIQHLYLELIMSAILAKWHFHGKHHSQ